MIYDRHEDLAATTKRHPAIVHPPDRGEGGRHARRPGDRGRDGRRGVLHADAGRPEPRRDPRRRPVPLPERPDPRPRHPDEHAAERRVPRVRRAAGRVRRRGPDGPDRRGASGSARSTSAGGTSTASGDETPTGQILRESVAAEEVLERAAEAAEFEGVRARTAARARRGGRAPGTSRARRCGPGRDRVASGIGVALAWHGAGFTGSGEVKLASVASLELAADGRVRILTGSTEMGQGTKTIFPQLVAAELGLTVEDVEMAPQDTALVPDSGPTVASRTAMVVGGLLIQAARRLRATVEERNGGRPFADVRVADAAAHGTTRIDEQFEPYPHVHFDDETYRGDAYPAFGWAACVATRRRRPRQRRGDGPRRGRGRRRRAGDPPGPAPRARSRAARSRRSATRRSRRSSSATAAT